LNATCQSIRRSSGGRKLFLLALALGLVGGAVLAQFRNAREFDSENSAAPAWTNQPGFEKDVFTFARLKYMVNGEYGYGHTDPRKRWLIDAPDSDLNFSFRLQQVTSIKVNPDGRFIELTDKELFDYPFIYIVEPGRLTFTDPEIDILKRYLLNGGFLMCDDFWGDREWRNFAKELKKVFPDREPADLPLSHPIFHGVFDLKELPQVPGVELGIMAEYRGGQVSYRYSDEREVHYRAITDDKGRIMVLCCHNTDLGDGWERETYGEWYFETFSTRSYMMGVNIVTYAMTH